MEELEERVKELEKSFNILLGISEKQQEALILLSEQQKLLKGMIDLK